MYYIYKTTNLINGKFYVGAHKTKNPKDSYLGSGSLLLKAISKYGRNNFKKEILFEFDNSEEMFKKEAEIVNERFIIDKNTYNVKIGGFGGWNYINNGSYEHIERCRKGGLNSRHNLSKGGFKKDPELAKRASKIANDKRQKNGLSEHHKIKLKKARIKNNELYKNKIWIENKKTKERKFINSIDFQNYDNCWFKCKEKSIKPTLWINDGKKNKLIKRELLEQYSEWNIGRICR